MVTTGEIAVRAQCRFCGAPIEVGQPFCSACGKVQPPSGVSYFMLFGLEKKLDLDLPGLEKQFYRFSRKLHPDVYAQAPEQEQQWSLAQASLLNNAYRTLKDPVERTKYLLKLEGVRFEDESESRSGGEESAAGTTDSARSARPVAKPPADLLEEAFELNMQLEELRMNRKMGDDDPALRQDLLRAKEQFAARLASLDEQLRSQWSAWDAAWDDEDEPAKTRARNAMTELLERRSYLRNLVDDVNETLAES